MLAIFIGSTDFVIDETTASHYRGFSATVARCANADRPGGGSPNQTCAGVLVSSAFSRSRSRSKNLTSSGLTFRGLLLTTKWVFFWCVPRGLMAIIMPRRFGSRALKALLKFALRKYGLRVVIMRKERPKGRRGVISNMESFYEKTFAQSAWQALRPKPFEDNKVDFSKFKMEPSASEIAKLAAATGTKAWPVQPIEVLSPAKTVGLGRTTLSLSKVNSRLMPQPFR
jgi:hypothetical protein